MRQLCVYYADDTFAASSSCGSRMLVTSSLPAQGSTFEMEEMRIASTTSTSRVSTQVLDLGMPRTGTACTYHDSSNRCFRPSLLANCATGYRELTTLLFGPLSSKLSHKSGPVTARNDRDPIFASIEQ